MARSVLFVVLFLSSLCLGACSRGGGSSPTPPPPAPAMPAHWEVSYDVAVAPDQVKQISKKLGGELTALRNTRYQVDGKTVQLNTLVLADIAAGDTVMAALNKMKSEVALLRAGPVIYEFVGSNDVLPEIIKAREFLAASPGGQ